MSEAHERQPRPAGHPPRESFAQTLLDVLKALLAAPVRRIPPRASERLIAACAMVALICPLLLWISWSRTGFFIVTGVALGSVAIIYLLIWVHPDDPF